MGWTKQQFIEMAFNEIGLASYVFDLSPNQLQAALFSMDSMLAPWNAKGIRIGYPLPSSEYASSLTQETGTPDSANEAIYLNLAIRLAPSYGKIVSTDTKISAKQAYNALLARSFKVIPMQLPGTMPAGAGNKPWRFNGDPFLQPPVNPVDVGPDGILELY